jgi:hypothetical protein
MQHADQRSGVERGDRAERVPGDPRATIRHRVSTHDVACWTMIRQAAAGEECGCLLGLLEKKT